MPKCKNAFSVHPQVDKSMSADSARHLQRMHLHVSNTQPSIYGRKPNV